MHADRSGWAGRALEDVCFPGGVDQVEPADADEPEKGRGEQHGALLSRKLRGAFKRLPRACRDHADGGSAAGPSGAGCARSSSSRIAKGLMPAACSCAASRDCATLAVTVTPTSGCSMTRTRCMPKVLIGRSRTSWLRDRKSTRLNSSYPSISYAVFCLKKKKKTYRVLYRKKKKRKKRMKETKM